MEDCGAVSAAATPFERSHTDHDESTELESMVRGHLVAERAAVETYRQIISVVAQRHPPTRRMLEDIFALEEERTNALEDLL